MKFNFFKVKGKVYYSRIVKNLKVPQIAMVVAEEEGGLRGKQD